MITVGYESTGLLTKHRLVPPDQIGDWQRKKSPAGDSKVILSFRILFSSFLSETTPASLSISGDTSIAV